MIGGFDCVIDTNHHIALSCAPDSIQGPIESLLGSCLESALVFCIRFEATVFA